MESFRSRLEFANVSVKSRVLSKVVENILSKDKDQIAPNQTPELMLLWEKCNDESLTTSKLCCQSIISLTSQKKLDSLSAIDELLSFVTSFKHLAVFVQTVNDLLLLNMKEQVEFAKTYRCPYSVSMPMHPFIVILRERSESWPIVYQCIHSVMQEQKNGFEIMKPVASYVLLEPSSIYTSSFRNLLYNDLICFEEGRRFIFDCLPVLQPKSLAELMEAIFVIERLSTSINENTNKGDIESLLLISLSLCQAQEFPYSNVIIICKDIFQYQKVSSISIGICLVILSVLITDAVGTELYHLLCLGEIVLQEEGIPKSISSMLIFPLLSVLSGNYDDSIKNTAGRLIVAIEEYSSSTKVAEQIYENELNKYLSFSSHPIVSQAMQFVLMLKSFDEMNDELLKEKWVNGVLNFIKSKTHITSLLTNVTASILINSRNMTIYKKCLSCLELMATTQPEQSMSFFPLLLYKVRSDTDPSLQLTVLESLPCIATHAYSISAILNMIRLLAHYPKLKPQAIKLMVILWKKQERCFPYLKEMLEIDPSDTIGKLNEMLISQAMAMKNICDTHPQLYGTDILANISKIFNTCSSDASSPAVVLALQGVSSLCKAETIDLRTAWKALARKLASDKRPLVLKHLFGLLSLAPELKTSSQHYEKFMTAATEMLWKHVRTESDPQTIRAAYAALGQYPPEFHQLKVLPDVAKAKIIPPRVSTPLDLSKNIEELLGYVPGYCFIHLLESINNNDVLKGYEEFLAGLLKYEVSNMPKNVYHAGKVAVKQTKCDRSFSSVPEFLCIHYNDNRQPGMQGNLAFGVLLSYHPPVEIGKDGQPAKTSVLSEAEFYLQILTPLLQDVTIDTSDWYQCILLSHGWCEFIDRVFTTCIESEYLQKEIEKRSKEHTDKVEQMNIYRHVVDNLLGMIQNQSTGKPTSQANALLAVVGLTVCVWKYESNLNWAETVASDNTCNDLMLSVVETLLCAVEPHRETSVQIFSWLISGQKGGVTSLILQGYAALSFFHLVPLLIHSLPEYIAPVCKLLLHQIAVKSGSVLQLHCGISMGLFLQAVCQQQHQSDITINISIDNICKQLESLCCNNDEIQLGPFIGISLAGMSLCEDITESGQKCGREIQAFCFDLLRKTDPLSVSYDVLAQCTAIITISAQVNNLLESDSYKDVFELLDAYRNDRPQCCGSATAVGAITGLLNNSGYLSSPEEKHKLFQTWKSVVLSEKMPILHRVAALKGLGSLYGTYSCIHSLNKKNSDLTDLHELIQVAMKLFQTRDITLKNMAVCLLGEISRIPRTSNTSSLPSSYFYLDEKYLLRYILDFVIQCAKNSYEKSIHLLVCLHLLGKGYSKPFPPISWQTVLNPLLQMDAEVIEECLKILISQCSSSQVSSFLGSLIRKPEVVTSFGHILIPSFPALIKHLSTTNLKYFTSAVILPSLKSISGLQKYGKAVLEATLQSLSLAELPIATSETIKMLLINIACICFLKNVSYFQESRLTCILCNCLSYLPDDMLKNMYNETNTYCMPALILACGLIKLGRYPLAYINSFLDKIAASGKEVHETAIEVLLDLFRSYANAEKLKLGSSWLLELMNQIKSRVCNQSIDNAETDFFIYVYISATVGFSGIFFTYLIQVNTDVSKVDCSLLPALPRALPLLLEKELWNHLTDKTLDWLLFLVTNDAVSKILKCSIFAALCSLRKFKEFTKYSVYSQVLNLQL